MPTSAGHVVTTAILENERLTVWAFLGACMMLKVSFLCVSRRFVSIPAWSPLILAKEAHHCIRAQIAQSIASWPTAIHLHGWRKQRVHLQSAAPHHQAHPVCWQIWHVHRYSGEHIPNIIANVCRTLITPTPCRSRTAMARIELPIHPAGPATKARRMVA